SNLISELPLELTKPLKNVKVTEKETITLQCEVSKPGKKSQWFVDDEEIKPSDRIKFQTEGNVHKLVISKSILDDEGVYKVKIDEVESTAEVLVDELPIEIIKPLKDVKIQEKETATFKCEVSRTGATAKWLKDGKEITVGAEYEMKVDEVTFILIIKSVTMEQSGLYTIEIEDKKSSAKLNITGTNLFLLTMALPVLLGVGINLN
ncbi:hypothetical protein LOTGIDRAFT_141564, partial [Lottia gigantea]